MMNQTTDKIKNMKRMFQHIESNLISNLDAKLLSKLGYISYAQLYRDFYNLTGHSVKEYIRKRRLSNALALVKTSDFGLSEIAYRCGYSSHQAFCRAVKQTLAITPSDYKYSDAYYFFPPFNGEPLQSINVTSVTTPKTLCIRFYQSSIKNIENMAVNTFLQVYPNYSEQIFGRNGKQDGNRFCYELYLTDIEMNYEKLKSQGYEIAHKTPCNTSVFATSTVPNNEQKINAAWDYLYHVWLQNSMFEYTNEPYYEEYILKNGKPVKLKLYLPIKKRSEETKITLISNPRLCFIVSKAKGCNAEKIASQIVIEYLMSHYPYVVKTSRELYLYKSMDCYVCGIRISSELPITNAENVENINTDQCNYLVLESCVTGDYDKYTDILLTFAQNNGMVANRMGIFAVYDAKVSFDNLKIKMYCPIKIDTN
jgi:AraC-like DNA-binding protein